jgi:alpha-galactosidase
MTVPDGNRHLVRDYVSHTIRDNTLTVSLNGIGRDVVVDLRYRIDEESGVIARSIRIENRTKLPLPWKTLCSDLELGPSQRLRAALPNRALDGKNGI